MSNRPTLGRGLAALIPTDILEPDKPIARDAFRKVRLDRIRPNPEQPRMTFSGQALEQLAESIRAHGIITPLLVRRDNDGTGFVLVAGERRLRAAGLAGLEEVPVWVREEVDEREQLELALVENLQREDLDPVETAEAYRRLVEDFGLTQSEVARRVGKDRATVANAIRLLRLPEFVMAQLRANRITAGHAKALLALPGDEQVQRALTEIVERDLSVRATERLVKKMLQPTTGVRPRGSSPSTLAVRLSDDLSRCLGARVKVEPRARGEQGRIVIEYANHADLDRLVSALARD